MHQQSLPPNTHLEFSTVYFAYMPVANKTTNMSSPKSNSKPKRPSKNQTKAKSAEKEDFQQAHIGELETAKVPISPAMVKSSSAWQHASMMLKRQQMKATLKSSEERDQDPNTSERSQSDLHSVYGYGGARIGSGSCWSSLQSIFMIPQGLADIKASHAITLNPDASNNNLSGKLNSDGGLPRSKFNNGQIQQTSISRLGGGGVTKYPKTSLSGGL